MPSPLQLALTARDFNYSDLAARVDRSPAWIAEIAKGRRRPSRALAARIAAELDVDDRDLFDVDEIDAVVISFVRRTTAASLVPERLGDAAAAAEIADVLRGGAA